MNSKKQKNVLVIGVGTIGSPLISLFTRHKNEFGIDNVYFHKNTPLKVDLPNVKQFIKDGALLCTDGEKCHKFEELGAPPKMSTIDAIYSSTVVIDCTPKGVGLENKRKYYECYNDGSRTFVAQGSEFGFGKPYARGINEDAIKSKDNFIQVVSCNTHNIAILISTLNKVGSVRSGNFVCIRRASDISQDDEFCPGVSVDKHKDTVFGTHHARDAFELFKTKNQGCNVKLYSSSCKINSQYMHTIHFNIVIHDECLKEGFVMFEELILDALENSEYISLTEKKTSNRVFSFGREYGYYGRILTHTVISKPTITIKHIGNNDYEVIGFCFTPQDGNSLMSSVSIALKFLHNETWEQVNERLNCLSTYIFKEI